MWDDALSDEELRATIISSKACGMELELRELTRKLQPTDEHKKNCQRAVLFVKSAVSQAFSANPLQVEMVGSAAQGTDLEGSDLDIAWHLCGEDRERKIWRLWDKLRSPPLSNNLEVTDATRLFPHAACHFSVKLKAASTPTFQAHVVIDDAEVPAIPASSENLDVVLRKLCDTLAVSRDLVRMVKLWAANHGLSCQHEGYMNGVAWTVFVLCFLQRQRLVPSLGGASGAASQTGSLMELLRGFFQFVCAPQPRTPWGMSLTEGADCEAAPPPGSHVGPPPPLYLEDPVALKQGARKNLALTLGEAQWARILEESRRIADRLDPAKPQRWFYWAEVFDPQGLAGSGKRLPKLSETDESQSSCHAVPASVASMAPEAMKGGPAAFGQAFSSGSPQTPTSTGAPDGEKGGASHKGAWLSGTKGWPGKGPWDMKRQAYAEY